MSLPALLLRPASIAISALALALAACGGASSDETTTGSKTSGETIADNIEGALGEMAQGSADAPVTVIEYASVTCPHCATFHDSVYPAIKEKYVDTGKVRFIFREFPTAPAELSVAGSMLARCAADRGGDEAFFLVVNSLMKTQREWAASASPRDHLLKIGAQAGMDEAAFDTCVRRAELIELINENVSDAREKYRVNSTPSFILNGNLRHFSSVDDFSAALDEALEKAAE